MDDAKLDRLISFLEKTENLKNTMRSATTSAGRTESTAEHTWRLCLMIMVFADQFGDVDRERLLKLAIVHDLAECLTGDVPAVDQSGGPDKAALEREAMTELCCDLPAPLKDEFLALWEEYDAGRTEEARLVKGLDKLETIMQHTQGANPPGFAYDFNLTYGRAYTDAHPLLARVRARLDRKTSDRSTEGGEV